MKNILYFVIGSFFAPSFLWAQQPSLNSPNVSANALFLYRNSNFASDDLSTTRNGIDLEEAEVAFYSDVDPYTRLNILLSLHPEYEVNGTKVEKSFVLEPEELFVESNQVPNVTLKVGKFKATFGKHNYLHTHVFPFIDAPLGNTQLLGDEGLNDAGVSAAYLVPTDWFNEITLQYLQGEGENEEFNSPTPSDGVGLIHWKNLFDLSEALTMELGGSYAQGKNSIGGTTSLSGGDLTFKYRPIVGGKYHSWIFAIEYIHRNLEQPVAGARSKDEIAEAWNIWTKYQFAERWSFLLKRDEFQADGADSTLNTNALNNEKNGCHKMKNHQK